MQSLFTTLKKKYQRKKKDLKDSNRSGSSSDVASKVQKDFQTYIFLSWLADFLQIRQGRSNLPAHTTDDQEFSNELNEESVEEATGNVILKRKKTTILAISIMKATQLYQL